VNSGLPVYSELQSLAAMSRQGHLVGRQII
jgi:hypothetical protein